MAKFRVYFNRRGELPWSFDSGRGTEEIQVKDFTLHSISGNSKFDPSAGDNENSPTAWIEVIYSVVEVRDNVAHFFHNPDWKSPHTGDIR